ncbi:MAG: hypothetical protein PHW08_06980 [Kiritimatiellae bacterium]|nr:hypothetical protein [Kiritimatiellia bacterium]
MSQESSAWCKIIEAITAPLGFFVLALLIVEAFLATVLIGGNLEKTDQITGMWLGVVLFVLVNVTVSVLVWFKPENLTFDKDAHLKGRDQTAFGTDTKTVLDRDKMLPSVSTKGGH